MSPPTHDPDLGSPPASPLRILKHEFIRLQLVAAPEPDEAKDPISVTIGRDPREFPGRENVWDLDLTLQFGASGPDEKAPYSGELVIRGSFEIEKDYPLENRLRLIKVTGASILYGACREMLANLTARSSRGIMFLPSITFVGWDGGKNDDHF
jgi:preprotein translocase subunit SecB